MIEPMDVLVKAGEHDRRACPVWVQLPLPQGGVPTVRMTDEAGAPVTCQLEPSGTGTEDRLWLTWIVRDLPAGQERHYHIEAADPNEAPAATAGATATTAAGAAGATTGVTAAAAAAGTETARPPAQGEVSAPPERALSDGAARDGAAHAPTDHGPGVVLTELPDGQLSIHVGGQHFTTYYFGSDVVKPYFHPVIGPGGKPVTRAYPMVPDVPGETRDHPHHRGFYVAHGDVNGADHWSEGPNHATMRHAGFQRLVSGPVYGAFDETVEWLDRDGQRIIMTETRRITFFSLENDDRLFDVSLRFNASSGTVTFGDTKEGGLISIRVATSMDGPTRANPNGPGRIVNSYWGKQEDETWGKRAMWCDYTGPVDGETVGICMMDHPTNPRYPTHWHVRAYGLMTANPFGLHDFYKDSDAHRGDWTIPAYESRNFLYRVLIHRGDTEAAGIRDRYHEFVNLPAVQLL